MPQVHKAAVQITALSKAERPHVHTAPAPACTSLGTVARWSASAAQSHPRHKPGQVAPEPSSVTGLGRSTEPVQQMQKSLPANAGLEMEVATSHVVIRRA